MRRVFGKLKGFCESELEVITLILGGMARETKIISNCEMGKGLTYSDNFCGGSTKDLTIHTNGVK